VIVSVCCMLQSLGAVNVTPENVSLVSALKTTAAGEAPCAPTADGQTKVRAKNSNKTRFIFVFLPQTGAGDPLPQRGLATASARHAERDDSVRVVQYAALDRSR
jgi:hypothetical protein